MLSHTHLKLVKTRLIRLSSVHTDSAAVSSRRTPRTAVPCGGILLLHGTGENRTGFPVAGDGPVHAFAISACVDGFGCARVNDASAQDASPLAQFLQAPVASANRTALPRDMDCFVWWTLEDRTCPL